MNSEIHQWAIKWKVSHQALAELQQIFGILPEIPERLTGTGEAGVQSQVRLEAARKGLKLWRNNVGVLQDATGRPVRYGLGNDSPALNKVIKSGDLIGWRPIFILPEHVGHRFAQFVSRECKRPGWTYSASEHESAQLRWIKAVNADGGDAKFVTETGTL